MTRAILLGIQLVLRPSHLEVSRFVLMRGTTNWKPAYSCRRRSFRVRSHSVRIMSTQYSEELIARRYRICENVFWSNRYTNVHVSYGTNDTHSWPSQVVFMSYKVAQQWRDHDPSRYHHFLASGRPTQSNSCTDSCEKPALLLKAVLPLSPSLANP